MVDGVQYDNTSPVLYMAWDGLSGTPLFGERKAFRGAEDLVPLLERVKAMDVKVIATVSDKEKGLVPAIADAFPETPHQLCQNHFLGSGSGSPRCHVSVLAAMFGKFSATEHTETHREDPCRVSCTRISPASSATPRSKCTGTSDRGSWELVYKNSLVNRLGKKGVQVDPKRKLTVRDEDGSVVGEYEPDLVVEDRVIVEIKAARSLNNEHVAQLLNYLKATGTRLGLLVNFGAARLQVKRYVFGPADSVSSVCSVAKKSVATPAG